MPQIIDNVDNHNYMDNEITDLLNGTDMMLIWEISSNELRPTTSEIRADTTDIIRMYLCRASFSFLKHKIYWKLQTVKDEDIRFPNI